MTDSSNDYDVKMLNSLITTTIDSANGFEEAAEASTSPRFEQMFRQYGQERRQCVTRLQDEVRRLGGDPEDDGSVKAAAHRRWLDFKNAVTGAEDKQVIEEVENGEDYIKNKYEEALRDERLSATARSVIQEAFRSVREGHDRASQLKHSMQGVG